MDIIEGHIQQRITIIRPVKERQIRDIIKVILLRLILVRVHFDHQCVISCRHRAAAKLQCSDPRRITQQTILPCIGDRVQRIGCIPCIKTDQQRIHIVIADITHGYAQIYRLALHDAVAIVREIYIRIQRSLRHRIIDHAPIIKLRWCAQRIIDSCKTQFQIRIDIGIDPRQCGVTAEERSRQRHFDTRSVYTYDGNGSVICSWIIECEQ